MATTTVGRVLLKFYTPAQFHHLIDSTILDKKGISKLFAEIADKAPNEYTKIVSDLTRLGFEISTQQGTSLTLKDLVSPVDKDKLWHGFETFKDKVESGKESRAHKDKKIFDHYNDMMGGIEKDILAKGLAENKSLAKIILAGSRGSPAQYRGTIATQGIVVDAEGKPRMDIPIKSSYAEGLTLPEYLVTSFGARSGEVMKKVSVAQGGYGCLEENTLVLMADYSNKAIKDIQIGDFVMGADMQGNFVPVRVNVKFDNGVQDVYEYFFRKGKQRDGFISFIATDRHKVLSKPTAKAEYAKHPLSRTKKHFSLKAGNGLKDVPVAVQLMPLIAGLFIGDGNLTNSTHLSLCSADTAMILALNAQLAEHGLTFKKARKREQDYEYYLVETVRSVRKRDVLGRILPGVTYNKASKYFDFIGIRGMKSYEKTLPRLAAEEMGSLLGGLFEADGYVSSTNNSTVPVLGFKSTSYKLICSVVDVLEKMFGIYPGKIQTIKADKVAPSKINLRGKVIDIVARRDAYTFVINDKRSIEKFAKVCHMPGVKGKKLRDLVQSIDVMGRYDEFAYHFNRLVYVGKRQVWDLEVEHPDHLFVLANGAIVSNSKQFARALMPLQVVEADCGTLNGISVAVSDKESVGAFLASAAGGYNRNNEITSRMLSDLASKGIKNIIVRSPMTCQSNKKHHSGGLCQMCVGRREKGMAAMDSYIGLVAGTAVAEPLTESAMKQRHCIFLDTPVAYPKPSDNKAIKDVKVGDVIMGADKSGKLVPTKVLDVIDQGQQEVYRYTFRYGKTNETFSIISTEDHVVLGGTYNCHNIEKNNPELLKIGTKHNKFHLYLGREFDDSTYTNNEPYAFLLGLLLGDGSYTAEKGSIQYYNFDETSITHIQDKLKPLGLKLHQSTTRAAQYLVTTITSEHLVPSASETSCFGVVHKNPARLKLEQLGMWGKVHYEKAIPDAAYTWTNNAIAELLSGLFFTDGSVNFDKDKSKCADQTFKSYSYGSSSEKLVTQIKYFLETRFGIYTSAVTTNHKKGKAYNIQGRSGTCKHNAYSVRIRRPEAVQRFDEKIKLFGAKFNKCQDVELYKAKDLRREYYRCSIVSIEPLGSKHCYDLTVDCPDNLFVLANGAIVHNSGGAATSLGTGLSGFKLINQLANVPKTFIGRAPLAQEDGVVTKLEPGAAGGHFVSVNNEEHYIGLGQEPKVKLGDRVEQGQVLSTGLVDPREVVERRGIGEGRKYYMEAMKKAFDDSGLGVNRRNFELIAKAAVDHVKITDHEGIGNYLPDQVVSYSAIEKDYQPRADSKQLRLDLAYGKYLEQPELHYSIGTKITSAVITELRQHHIESVLVHNEHPHFEPVMVRLVDIPEHNDDWMAVLNSTNLAKRFVNMVNKGATSDTAGPHPVPGLAKGVGFGEKS